MQCLSSIGDCSRYECVQLLDTKAVGVRREKMYKIDDHVACAVAGITSDANILINTFSMSSACT